MTEGDRRTRKSAPTGAPYYEHQLEHKICHLVFHQGRDPCDAPLRSPRSPRRWQLIRRTRGGWSPKPDLPRSQGTGGTKKIKFDIPGIKSICHCKVELAENLHLSGLPGIQPLPYVDEGEIFMVSLDCKRLFYPLQPMLPLHQRHFHRQKLSVSHVVVPLHIC